MKALLIALSLFVSTATFAGDRMTFFVKQESNASDSLSGVGFSGIISTPRSHVKGEVITSLNAVTVLDNDGYQQEFLGLDLGLRVGYFNDVFVYIEGGFDAFESSFKDYDRVNDYYSEDTVDGYASVGGGFQAGPLRIEGYVKARQINADTWQSDKALFYGIQTSIAF
ncbi:hypothetical protein ISG33_10355 [Glaciecola sp. MH2013]|uniref:hypothetical protein n=1 Tax=Glaciecola sp. MH2013 TaxID=2785524 RepID=UPI0018A0F605|nr:hypothetical protein [Glaciecola sp. MH2013]MBF7073799.1 hypothetical protein [Glaciecola sp. MH2013]